MTKKVKPPNYKSVNPRLHENINQIWRKSFKPFQRHCVQNYLMDGRADQKKQTKNNTVTIADIQRLSMHEFKLLNTRRQHYLNAQFDK